MASLDQVGLKAIGFKLMITLMIGFLLLVGVANSETQARAAFSSGKIRADFMFTSLAAHCSSSSSSRESIPIKLVFSIEGLKKNAQYTYHIHEGPVPLNGNCTATKGHFDPNKANKNPSSYKCDPAKIVETCELGDLSGVFGKAEIMHANNVYHRSVVLNHLSLSTDMNDKNRKYNVLNRSVVIHDETNSRIACGNITLVPTVVIIENRKC